jgi:hypothetical protein
LAWSCTAACSFCRAKEGAEQVFDAFLHAWQLLEEDVRARRRPRHQVVDGA